MVCFALYPTKFCWARFCGETRDLRYAEALQISCQTKIFGKAKDFVRTFTRLNFHKNIRAPIERVMRLFKLGLSKNSIM